VQTLPVLALTAVVGAFLLLVSFIFSYIKKGSAPAASDENGNSSSSTDDTVKCVVRGR
jgi:hypothetical protein